jgi:hypothetical protein
MATATITIGGRASAITVLLDGGHAIQARVRRYNHLVTPET